MFGEKGDKGFPEGRRDAPGGAAPATTVHQLLGAAAADPPPAAGNRLATSARTAVKPTAVLSLRLPRARHKGC